jgi:hypothetical protein
MIGAFIFIGVIALTYALVVWAALTAPVLPPWIQELREFREEQEGIHEK